MGKNGFEARAIGIAARRRGTVSKATSVDAKYGPCVSDDVWMSVDVMKRRMFLTLSDFLLHEEKVGGLADGVCIQSIC